MDIKKEEKETGEGINFETKEEKENGEAAEGVKNKSNETEIKTKDEKGDDTTQTKDKDIQDGEGDEAGKDLKEGEEKTPTQAKKEKRLQERREKYKYRMVEKRKRKKEEKKKKKELEKAQVEEKQTGELEKGDKPPNGEWIKKPNFLRQRKLEAKAKCKSGQRIAIDLGFGDLMNDSELASVLNQVKHAYGKNLTVANPFHMYLVSINTPQMANRLQKMQGYENWEVEKEERGYLDLFPASEIVYLSPDSPNILTEVDPSKVYVIGGLSDYNRAKNTSFDKATQDGVSTAKLPLHLLNMDPSVVPILCIDHVFLTLLYYSMSNNWIDAMYKALPARKTRTANPLLLPSSPAASPAPTTNLDCIQDEISTIKIS